MNHVFRPQRHTTFQFPSTCTAASDSMCIPFIHFILHRIHNIIILINILLSHTKLFALFPFSFFFAISHHIRICSCVNRNQNMAKHQTISVTVCRFGAFSAHPHNKCYHCDEIFFRSRFKSEPFQSLLPVAEQSEQRKWLKPSFRNSEITISENNESNCYKCTH